MNNNQRINQLLMQTRGLSSTNLEGTALIERLRKEAFALAAWSCREIDRITAERDEAMEFVRGVANDINALSTRPKDAIRFSELVYTIQVWGDNANEMLKKKGNTNA